MAKFNTGDLVRLHKYNENQWPYNVWTRSQRDKFQGLFSKTLQITASDIHGASADNITYYYVLETTLAIREDWLIKVGDAPIGKKRPDRGEKVRFSNKKVTSDSFPWTDWHSSQKNEFIELCREKKIFEIRSVIRNYSHSHGKVDMYELKPGFSYIPEDYFERINEEPLKKMKAKDFLDTVISLRA